ncbi:MAG TPA: DUF2231 domain-containing protein [Micromonosporaceae bacterium]
MLDTFAGLPLHPLVVHATVVVVPVAALVVGLAGTWPWFRARFGRIALPLSALALVLVPLTVRSGEALRGRLEPNDLVDRHGELGAGLLPWVVALLVAAAATVRLRRREQRPAAGESAGPGGSVSGQPAARLVVVAVAVLAVASAAGTVASIVRIGHSGAEAAWSDVATGD